MKKTSSIYVAGHTGLVGSSIIKALKRKGYSNIITYSHEECDLTIPWLADTVFRQRIPEYVFLAAAKVGGIHANMLYPGEFIRDNLQIQTNVMEAARKFGTTKLLFLGSSCIYPKFAEQPMKEESLLSGPLESSNIGYALAKIAGNEMCKAYRKQWGCNYISAMPSNLYGENDNFSLMNSHCLPAMIRKFHEAKLSNITEVTLWGSGNSKREFLHSEDLAEALIFLMETYNGEDHINVGTGEDVTIKELAGIIKKIVGYEGEIYWDDSVPDGTPRKLLNVSKLNNLGWKSNIPLYEGAERTYEWFKDNYNTLRR